MGTPKRAKRARAAGEFDLVKLAAELRPMVSNNLFFAWDLESIRTARTAQLHGNMQPAASLALAVKTDAAIYSALQNRLAPQRGLPIELAAANDTALAKIQKCEGEDLFGQDGITLPTEVRTEIGEALAMHGFSVATNVWTPRCDGRRVDVEIRPWPMEHVRFNRATKMLETRTESHGLEEIRHGNGRWIVFAQTRTSPWGWGALLALALIWADRAFGIRDRSRASTSHGNAKMIGELPQGIPLDGPEAAAFLLLLKTMHEALPYGIRPAGAKTDMLVNTSTAWQVFKEIIDSNLSDAARVLLGHDGTIRAAGGNYIKDGYLFGVSADIVESDVHTIERGLYTGTIEPWAAMNYGSSDHAPRVKYKLPDADADTLRSAMAARKKAFWEDIAATKANGFALTQKYVDELAEDYGVRPPSLTVAVDVDGTTIDQAYEAAAELAVKMTELGVERCEHDRCNRCHLCGIERMHDVSIDEAGQPTWAIAWQPIGGFKAVSSNDPASADLAEPQDPLQVH